MHKVRVYVSACNIALTPNNYGEAWTTFLVAAPDDIGSGGGDGSCMGEGSPLVGKPVNLSNGNVFVSQNDFTLPGIMPINFTRYYNSKETITRGFGQYWSHSFDAKVISLSLNTYKIINPDGSRVYYRDINVDGIYEAEFHNKGKSSLIRNIDGTYVREFPDGKKEEFNTIGYITAIKDRNGNRISLFRGSNNELTKITDPSGREINIINDTSGRITSITLPDGKVYSYSYPYPYLLGSVTYPNMTQKQYLYASQRLTDIKNENGKVIEKHTYDTIGRAITSSADGTKEKLTISYGSNNQSTVTDSLGRVTTYTINKSGGKSHITSIIGPGCSECGQGDTSYTYDENLNISSKTDANGNVTTMTYDDKGNMLTRTEAYGTPQQRTTTYTYEANFNQVTSITDPLGNTTNFTYDTNGNLISVVDAAGAVTGFTRNAQGLITQITDSLGNTTDFAYDQYGNISTITDDLGNITSFNYDILGSPLSMTDANGKQTNYTYDQRSRITQIRDSMNQLTTYSYDPAGNLTAVTDAKGNATQFVYDSINRLIKEITALGKERIYTYDTQSNLTTVKDANLRTTTYSYDNRNRPVTITHPDATQTTFTYDNKGNITGAANQNMSYSITHDALNRVTAVLDSLSRNVSYTYDANSNRLSMTSPAGTTTYAYNNLNRLSSETNPANGVFTFSYNSLGQRTGIDYPNGVTTTYTYDAISRLVNMLTQNTVPSTINTYTYTHDNVGNRTGMTDTAGTHNYTYDEIYRLVQATHPALPTEQYSYDPVGNRIGTTVDAGNRLLEDATYTYQYDNNGNMTQKTNRTTGEITTLTYDTQNRLVQVTKPGMTVSYKHDPFGRRIEKNVNGIITKYLYDGEDIVIEYDGNGNMIAKYTHGHGIDEPLSMEKNGQSYYYHQDGLGSITALTDGVGDLAHRYEYNAYGKITSVLDPNLKQPFIYTGREYDEETGLYYYRARYYDADIGRFISEDPIGLAGGINVYAYVGNNPVNWIDPLGLYWQYSQSTGQLTYVNNQTGATTSVGTGYSGYGAGLNNPNMQHVPYTGPIPQGAYNIGPAYNHANLGPVTMNLDPSAGTNTFGRNAFRIHGDNPCGCQSASQGCIVFPRNIRHQMSGNGDRELRVVP